MKQTHLIILTTTFLFFACHNVQTNVARQFGIESEKDVINELMIMDIIGTPKMITVPKYAPDDEILGCVDDIYESIRITKLETTQDCIVGSITKIEIVNDTIYILDAKTKSVFSFSMEGKFLRKFGKIGQGPGEYTEPTSISVNGDCLLIYDQWQHKVIKYDHSGKMLSSLFVPFFCRKIIQSEHGNMLCFEEAADNYHLPSILDYCFWICDSTYKHISKVGLYSQHDKTIPYGNLLVSHYNNKLFYFSITKNSFYEIVSDSCFKHLAKVTFDPEYPDEFYTNKDYWIKEQKEHNAVNVSDFYMTDHHIIYCVSGHGKKPCYFFYNFKDNEYRFFNQIDIGVSQISRLIYNVDVRTIYNNMVVTCMSPEMIYYIVHQYSEDDNLWEGASEQVKVFDKQLFESINEDDNDILVFAKIKEHFD